MLTRDRDTITAPHSPPTPPGVTPEQYASQLEKPLSSFGCGPPKVQQTKMRFRISFRMERALWRREISGVSLLGAGKNAVQSLPPPKLSRVTFQLPGAGGNPGLPTQPFQRVLCNLAKKLGGLKSERREKNQTSNMFSFPGGISLSCHSLSARESGGLGLMVIVTARLVSQDSPPPGSVSPLLSHCWNQGALPASFLYLLLGVVLHPAVLRSCSLLCFQKLILAGLSSIWGP